MWFSFWRSRNRFSLEELRYLTDQLQKIQIVNEVNKDFVIEALRSIAELVTYGDQHDPSFFEFFMEEQIMSEFARILRISRPTKVAVQLLQTMSIMIQNLRNEHAIYYIFSNEHFNFLITYSFDFQNEELLSYYISFLRAISGKLNKNTISLLVKTQNDEVVSFPLYVEAIRFAFHEETMVRIAVRALTLNVFHVGDEYVNRYVSRPPLSDYFLNMVKYFQKHCANLDELISQAARHPYPSDSSSSILAAVDEIEDNLYYFSDVISAGVPDLGILITDNILRLLVFPLLLPSLKKQSGGAQIGITTSLYLLCCILHIFKSKDLASIIAATLFYPPEVFVMKFESSPNGYTFEHRVSQEHQQHDPFSLDAQANTEDLGVSTLDCSGSAQHVLPNHCSSRSNTCGSQCTLREVLLSYVSGGNDLEVLGSLSFLATLLQTKDGLGILPQRKQHKKLLLQALVGEDSGEEQLFSSENSMMKDSITTELDGYLHKLEDQFGLLSHCAEQGISSQLHRSQVLDALVSLFCRSDVSADILWAGGWLLRQLLPHGEEEFTSLHLERLKDSNKSSTAYLLTEIKGIWCDLLITVLKDQWKNCKRAIEASSPPKNPKSILLPSQTLSSGGESSFVAGERMREMVKVFVLQRQLLFLSFGGTLADLPPIHSPIDSPVSSQTKTVGLDVLVPKPGCEINLVNALPCRIAFERGKERHFRFLALSRGTSGWILLAEELPLNQQSGIIRVTAPLAGSDPRIDEKHSKWLHLCIRPSTFPFLDPAKYDAFSKGKAKILVDGRWTLAFRDEQSCKTAESMVIEEINLQRREVEQRLKPLLELDIPGLTREPCTLEASTAEAG
ncbi:protein TRANSPARENT TESTA 9-like isoform X2 [Phoenix dactylifera]|uniref:Protein TRANSPARENT TESTA 9-like isoform X2 n=1 Tax=Phoenix dactylifera TaxID=42345 RepID=A0A8B7CI72_PHODC|nr:protein TRANSPARENT TESTA 9-like isoform X2 [Phoenix dactylifera]